MQKKKLIEIVGVIEISIGSIAILSNFFAIALSLNTKTLNVLIFVILTGCVSTFLGIGLLKHKKKALEALVYFSSVIVFSKILLMLNIIELNGQLEVTIHKIFNIPLTDWFHKLMNYTKDAISIAYHSFVIYYFRREDIKKIFKK